MKKERIEKLLKEASLRIRSVDKGKIESMIDSALRNSKIVLSMSLNENSATVIFREIYESLRQLGDAYLWSLGYEPRDHDVSLEALMSLEIKDKVKLNFIDRFKTIRNDANYRGFMVSLSQAKEIIELWNSCSSDIIKIIKKGLEELKE